MNFVYEGDYDRSVVLEFTRLSFEIDNPDGCDGLFFDDYETIVVYFSDYYVYIRMYSGNDACTRIIPIGNFVSYLRDRNIDLCLI